MRRIFLISAPAKPDESVFGVVICDVSEEIIVMKKEIKLVLTVALRSTNNRRLTACMRAQAEEHHGPAVNSEVIINKLLEKREEEIC